MSRRWIARTAAVVALAAGSLALAQNATPKLSPAAEQLRSLYPGVQFYFEGPQVRTIYGTPMSVGMNPEQAAAQFLQNHGQAFGAGQLELTPHEVVTIQNGRFTVYPYSQSIQGMPVEYGQVRVLVLNQPVPRVVYASGRLAAAPAGGFPDSVVTGSQALAAVKNIRQYGDLKVWSLPAAVVYQGDDTWEAPQRVWKFTGEGAANRAFTFFVNMSTGLLVLARNEVIDTDVSGTIKGMGTPGKQADHAGNLPTLLNIPEVLMTIQGGNSAYSDCDGNFTIPNPGTTAVTVTSNASEGRWVNVNPQGGVPEVSVNLPGVIPGGVPAAGVFNAVPSATSTAQVNLMIHADLTHNHYTDRAPGFVLNKINGNTGVAGSCNAFFTTGGGSSINFYNAGGGCNNTAFSSVIAHEYGHYVVNQRPGGLSQGAFGEGLGDTCAILMYDTGLMGEFFSTGGGLVRNLITTTRTYPCSGGVHDCGEVLGAFWYRAMENFKTKYGSATGLENVRDLQVAWFMVTGGGSGSNGAHPATAIEVLTVDDNDGNLANGTPNYAEICSSFALRNIQCPVLSILAFSYPTGLPNSLTPGQPTTFRVDVTGQSATPQAGTGQVTYSANFGSFVTVAMTEIAPNQYEATLPGVDCGESVRFYVGAQTTGGQTITDPPNAPTAFFAAAASTAGAVETTVADLNFEADPAWTVANTAVSTGAWERAVPHTPPSAQCPPSDFDGSGRCFVTDNRSGNFDLDGGPTILTTGTFDLSQYSTAKVSYARWIQSVNGVTDTLSVEVSADNGQSWTLLETATPTPWTVKEWTLSSFIPMSSSVRFRFRVSDNPNDSLTEAAIDRFKLVGLSCGSTCYPDCNGDQLLNLADFGCFQTAFASGNMYADCNGDQLLNLADFGCFQTEFATGCP